MKALRLFTNVLITGLLALAFFPSSALAQTSETGCTGDVNPADNGPVALCFSSPANGSTLSGDVTVAISTNLTSESADISSMIFTLNGVYLLTTYSSPYTFILPTEKWADGSYIIKASNVSRDGDTAALASITVTFKNGNEFAPVNSNHFTPAIGTTPADGAPFVVAAAGDGASGESTSVDVVNTITSLEPNLFLYLGDVYESGSQTEFYNWYGTGLKNFSVLRAITDPTIGNHEYTNGVNGVGYFDYWNNIPNYYSFNAGGWHFISLNSNLTKLGGNPPGINQFYWLQNDLYNNAKTCTIVFYHAPLFNIGEEGQNYVMQTVWALLAQYKVPIVLNGHDHDYQRWEPLDGKGNPSPDGTTEFVAGGGGHGLTDFIKTDSRVAYSNSLNPTAFGVLLLQLDASGANFSYHSSDGSVLDSGYVPCSQSGTVAVTKASQTALSLAITPTLADPPANTPDPTDVATLAAAPTRTLVPTETPVEVGEVPSSPYKSPVFTGAITLGGFSIVVIITGLILLFRRRN